MSMLHAFFSRPVATVRIDASLPWQTSAARPTSAPKPPIPPFWSNVLQSMREQKPSLRERGFLGRLFAGRASATRTRLEVLSRVSLGQKSSLVLVEVEGSRMVVGIGADGTPSVTPLPRHVRSERSRLLRPTRARRRA